MPKVRVRLAKALADSLGLPSSLQAEGRNAQEALQDLCRRHAALGPRLFDEAGNVRRFVSVFLNGEDLRALGGGNASLREGDELLILPAIAGGSHATALRLP
jgi:molybdopterin synthase sulfur carrier subunit